MKGSRRRAFTVVELLAVVGIIAVLIALFSPAVKRARAQAKAVVCAANERQILAAWHTYISDNDGAVPVIVTRGPPGIWGPNLSGPAGCLMYYMSPMNGGNGILDFQHGALWRYISSEVVQLDSPMISVRQRLLNCPADEAFRAVATGDKLNLTGAMERNFTYSWNVLLKKGDDAGGFPMVARLENIRNAAHKIVLCEEERPNDGACYIGAGGSLEFGGGDDTPTWRHYGGGNWGFADGHVERLEPSDLGYSIVDTDTATATPVDMMRVNYYFGLGVSN